MEPHLQEIATIVGRLLLNPFVLVIPTLGALALITGAAARMTVWVEEFMHLRTRAGVAGHLGSQR